jgi:primosomal replication protein N
VKPFNTVVAGGTLIDKQALRHTPAGVPVLEFGLLHESVQQEAGAKRQVHCEVPCICIGKLASDLARLADGDALTVKGFMAARSRRWPQRLVLHVTAYRVAVQTQPSG